MSLPRQVLPATTYLLTRRVAQRQFLLTPSGTVNVVVRYCLHRAAGLYGVELHAVQVLSNHVHIVATDTRGELPCFMAWFDREVAKCLNEHYERAEAFWSSDHEVDPVSAAYPTMPTPAVPRMNALSESDIEGAFGHAQSFVDPRSTLPTCCLNPPGGGFGLPASRFSLSVRPLS